VRHSEYNASKEVPLHLYQVWIIPESTGIEPRYAQRRFDDVQGRQLVLSPDARDGSLKVFQDMTLSRWALKAAEEGVVEVEEGRRIWIQVVKGDVTVNGEAATTSDAFAIWDEKSLAINASSDAEILLFDLPPV
jgi:hypothetical protein